MTPTIYDVAERADVGIATVSRVLNNSPKVSDATRERVLAAVRELNYKPNKTARDLSLGREPEQRLTIGVIAPFFTRPAFVERLHGIEVAVAERNYELIIYNAETPELRERCFREATGRVDGLIIVSLPPTENDVDYIRRTDVPTVLVDAQHVELSRVITDDIEGGRLATQHLIDCGHRKIAYISDPFETPFNFAASRDRYVGYMHALEDAGIPLRDEYVLQGEHGQYQARLLTRQLLALDDPPTAIFAFSDTQALGVLGALRESGLSCPEDVALIGFDDIEVAQYIGLTTVHQPLYESGLRAFRLLMDTLEDDAPEAAPREVILPVSLVERQTTAHEETT